MIRPQTDIRTITNDLGFGTYAFVRDRISVADLFKPNRRCGLYALHFANADGYVGMSIDVVRRIVGSPAQCAPCTVLRPMTRGNW